MEKLLNSIKDLSIHLHTDTVAFRHHLHQNPELSFQEYNTAAYVESKLTSLGIETTRMAGTGVVALIRGQNPEIATIALRADMDALPITEVSNKAYKSKVDGVMHACGHDCHTSSLLSTAAILKQVSNQFEGTVKLIFQPGEEKLPGGASLMIKEGILSNPAPQSVIGQHVMPLLPAGTIGFREGMYMASADEIYITITGKGGHGAMPDQCIDPVPIMAQMITALQQVVSRKANPKIPSVLSFGKVIANGATNIIPNSVYLEGTFRTMDEVWRAEAHAQMKKIGVGIAEAMGATCQFDVLFGYPFLYNDIALTKTLRGAAESYMGADNVVDLDLWMAAEDFSYYTQNAPGCFYRLGTRNQAEGIISGVHTPTFDIDESALAHSPGLMAWLAITQLKHLSK